VEITTSCGGTSPRGSKGGHAQRQLDVKSPGWRNSLRSGTDEDDQHLFRVESRRTCDALTTVTAVLQRVHFQDGKMDMPYRELV
jgi:CHAD domain-containing protein